MHFRKGFFAVIFILFFVAASGQFKKGDRMAGTSVASIFFNSGGADVSYPQTRGYSTRTSNYGVKIEPLFGWFISEKTAIGALLNINPAGQKIRYEDGGTAFREDRSTNFNIAVGAFLRNYFGASSSFMPYGQFGFNTGISSATSEGFRYYSGTPGSKVSYDGKSSGGFFANASLQLGLTKMIGENTGLDIFLGYNYSYSKNTYKTVTSTDADLDGVIDFTAPDEPTTKFSNHGAVAGIGFQIFLRGKK